MNYQDSKFFEAYKRLDKLCGEVFGCKNGVSEYISQMEKSPQGYRSVDSWKSDYDKLKHIRWVRNQIAHEYSDYEISTEDDIEFAELFYKRIMTQDDPFARLIRAEQEKKCNNSMRSSYGKSSCQSKEFEPSAYSQNRQSKKNTVDWLRFFAVVFVLLLLYILIR